MHTPTPTDELKRKSIEALDWLTDQAVKGKISERTLSVAADAIWMTASGLTGSVLLEPMEVITEATGSTDTRLTVALIFDSLKLLAVVTCLPEEEFITVQISGLSPRQIPVDDGNRKERFHTCVAHLESKGYRRL